MGKYDKNYTDREYLLNYKTPKLTAPQKRRVLQFRVELLEIEPLVWRRIQIDSASNFWDLHVAIQDAMGWLDYHLHRFEIRGKGKRDEYHIGMPDCTVRHGVAVSAVRAFHQQYHPKRKLLR